MSILSGFVVLMGCQLIGEVLQGAFCLPIPGSIIGMCLLAAALVLGERGGGRDTSNRRAGLEHLSQRLIAMMGLFFVPAGAGLVAQADLLKREWPVVLTAVAGSTILSIIATGLAMHFVCHPRARRTYAEISQAPG